MAMSKGSSDNRRAANRQVADAGWLAVTQDATRGVHAIPQKEAAYSASVGADGD